MKNRNIKIKRMPVIGRNSFSVGTGYCSDDII